METLNWTKQQAREYLVRYHFINLKEPLTGKEAIKNIFDRLLTIQFDPLDNVGRNPDLVLQSRIKDYKKEYLHELLYKERYLLDSWDKQMSIIKTEDFPYFKRIREDRERATLSSFQYHNIEGAVDFKDEVLNQIKEKGPLFSREINIENQRWKHGKLSSVTLDYLFNIGDIVVYNKENSQKQFALTESVFDFPNIDIDEEDFIEWYMKRRIKTLGLFWNRSYAWSGLHIEKKSIRTKYIHKLLKEDFIKKVQIEEIKEPIYVLTEFLENSDEIKNQISFIAPLDNMIWDRDLINYLFDFDYKWEVYVPKHLRKYGYYVLPILYGSDFIGRIEFENHHPKEPLVIKNIWFEEKIKITKKITNDLDSGLKRFAKYLDATGIVYPKNEEV